MRPSPRSSSLQLPQLSLDLSIEVLLLLLFVLLLAHPERLPPLLVLLVLAGEHEHQEHGHHSRQDILHCSSSLSPSWNSCQGLLSQSSASSEASGPLMFKGRLCSTKL